MKKKIFLHYQNVEKKTISWLEMREELTESKGAKKLSLTALGFYVHIIRIIKQNFDIWNPGALKMSYKEFRDSLFPIVRHRKTVTKYLELLSKLGLIYFKIEGGYIILYCPYVEKASKYFVKRRKHNQIEIPVGARDLLRHCKLYIKGELL